MIEAERVLLRHALRDPFNHRFVFLSDRWDWFCKYFFMSWLQLMTCLTKFQFVWFLLSCIPLYSFSYTYNYIMSTPTSFVDRSVLLKYITPYFNFDTDKKNMFMLLSLNIFLYCSFADTKDSRYNPRMNPIIPVHNWRKGSQVKFWSLVV